MNYQECQQMVITEGDEAYIYRVSQYESKRHTVSYCDMYFALAKDAIWGLNGCCLTKVELIKVKMSSHYYDSAISNSVRSSTKKQPK